MRLNVMRSVVSALVVAAAFGAPCAKADAVADFYRGKTVTLIVSGSAGGGYDTLARLISKFIGKHVPGNPSIIVKNMPGAGGLIATNHMFTVAPRDGTVIASPQNNVPFEPLYGTKNADYDATRFNWLGSPAPEVSILTVWHTVPVDTWQDATKRELIMGASGANSTPSFYGRIFMETLGVKLKIIPGFPGQNDALLAMERGEIDGYPSVFYNSLMSTRPTWIAEKKVKLLVQIGAEREPAIPDVPFAADLAKNADDKLLIEQGAAPLAVGRPYLLPPEVPAERVEALRAAFMATMKDPDFLAEQDKLQLGANQPKSGAQIQEIVARAYRTPPQVLDRLKKISGNSD
jgi:tripartite-type tricarboxylate transporter receptor subunit TctC